MKLVRVAVVVLPLTLLGCAIASTSGTAVNAAKTGSSSSDQEPWKAIVGKWYGSQPGTDGGRLEWIAERNSEGRYKMHSRTTDKDGRVSQYIEAGEWGMSGPVYFTIRIGWIRDDRFVHKPPDPENRDAYRVISLTDESFIYEHFATANRYTDRRVPESFEFGQSSSKR